MNERNPTDLRGRQEAKDAQALANRVARETELRQMRWLMGNAEGRRFMWALLGKTGMFRTSFTGNSETFFREGARNIGLMMMDMINEACPEQYTVMVNEAKEGEKADK